MAKKAKRPALEFLRTGPAQYVNRAGILRKAGACIAPWGNRALISGGKKALEAAEEPLVKSLSKSGIVCRRHLFSGEASLSNAAKVKKEALALGANVIIGVGGGKSLDTAKQAAADLGLPLVCIPTIAATCAASTALSVIYNDRGEFYRDHVHPRNPSLVLVDPEVLTRAPGMYLRAGILDSMAKWFEGRSVYPCVPNPDLQTNMAIHLAEVLYQGHRKHALEAVHLNSEGRLGYDLSQTLDLVLLLTGVIQTLAKGTLFTAVAHPLHNGLTVMEESRGVLHGLKVGYGIIVQLWIEKRPKKEFEDVLYFFRQLGLEPSLQGLNLPSDPEIIRRVAEKAAGNAERGPLGYPVNNVVIARAMRELEQRLA